MSNAIKTEVEIKELAAEAEVTCRVSEAAEADATEATAIAEAAEAAVCYAEAEAAEAVGGAAALAADLRHADAIANAKVARSNAEAEAADAKYASEAARTACDKSDAAAEAFYADKMQGIDARVRQAADILASACIDAGAIGYEDAGEVCMNAIVELQEVYAGAGENAEVAS